MFFEFNTTCEEIGKEYFGKFGILFSNKPQNFLQAYGAVLLSYKYITHLKPLYFFGSIVLYMHVDNL